MLRRTRLVSTAQHLSGARGGGAGRHGLRVERRLSTTAELRLLVPLFAGGLIRVLHGVPRRAGAPQARPAPPDLVLPDGLARRRAGRRSGGLDRAAFLQRIFRAADRAGELLRPDSIWCCVWTSPRWAPSLRPFWRPWLWAASAAITLGLSGYLGYEIREFRRGSLVLVRNFYGGAAGQ